MAKQGDVKEINEEHQLDSVNGFNEEVEEETGWRKRKKRDNVVPLTSTLGMSRCGKKLFEIFLNHLASEEKKAWGEICLFTSY